MWLSRQPPRRRKALAAAKLEATPGAAPDALLANSPMTTAKLHHPSGHDPCEAATRLDVAQTKSPGAWPGYAPCSHESEEPLRLRPTLGVSKRTTRYRSGRCASW